MTNEEPRKNTEGEGYEKALLEIIAKIKNKKLLRRIYELAEYLYMYEDGE